MLTPELDENTEKLSTRARLLVNAEFRNLLGNPTKQNIQLSHNVSTSPPHPSVSKANRTNAVKTARKKIQEEWEALKNATMISNESPEGRISQVLNGVVAYIEINNVPKSIALKVILENLGATVNDKFTPEVTHVIFKRGTLETFKRAKLLNVCLVSVLWIEACKSSRKRVPEELFPVADHSDYATPRTFRRFVEMNSEDREKLLQTHQNAQKQKNAKPTNQRVTRSTGKSPVDSSESAIILQISTDDSGQKNKKSDHIKEAQAKKRRLFASAGDETIDHDGTKKKKLDSKMKRKLFTHRTDDSSLSKHSDSSRSSTPLNLRELNPYKAPGKQRIGRKKNVSKKREVIKEKITENSEQSSSESTNSESSIERLEQVRELIKLTQISEKTKKVKERKRRLIKEKKKKKLTKEEKENLRKANKMARRQENQFMKASQPRSCKKLNLYSNGVQNPSLVSTFMHKIENRWLKECIERLGGFTFKAVVDRDTTHVVAGAPVRTINLLKGLARGCWLVDKRWVQESLLAGHWLTEHDYELVQFSKAVQKCRLERQVLGDDYRMDIFRQSGGIFISLDCKVKRKDLRALVALCAGRAVSEPGCADIVVGQKVEGKTSVNEVWILDSVAAGRCKSLKKYTIL